MTTPSDLAPLDDANVMAKCNELRQRAAELDRFADELERQGNKVRTSCDVAAAANANFGYAIQTVANCASMHEVNQKVVTDIRQQATNMRTVADGLEEQARSHASLLANVNADVAGLQVFNKS